MLNINGERIFYTVNAIFYTRSVQNREADLPKSMAMNYFGRISPIIHVVLVAAIKISQMCTVMDARGTIRPAPYHF